MQHKMHDPEYTEFYDTMLFLMALTLTSAIAYKMYVESTHQQNGGKQILFGVVPVVPTK